MSLIEFSEWVDFFWENSFSDVLLDVEFFMLKVQVFMLVMGKEIDVVDFSLLILFGVVQSMMEQDLFEVVVGILGGVRFELESW